MALTSQAQDGAQLRRRRRERVARDIERIALELFAERDIETVTVEEIAARAEISYRTFFRYFSSKDDVLASDLRRRIDTLHAALNARPEGEPTLVSVRMALLAMAEAGDEDRERSKLWMRAASSTSTALPNLLAIQASFTMEVTVRLAAEMKVDPSEDVRPGVLAMTMVSAAYVAYQSWFLAGGERSLVELVTNALDVVQPGLEATLGVRTTRAARK